jgi:hypothetical protein
VKTSGGVDRKGTWEAVVLKHRNTPKRSPSKEHQAAIDAAIEEWNDLPLSWSDRVDRNGVALLRTMALTQLSVDGGFGGGSAAAAQSALQRATTAGFRVSGDMGYVQMDPKAPSFESQLSWGKAKGAPAEAASRALREALTSTAEGQGADLTQAFIWRSADEKGKFSFRAQYVDKDGLAHQVLVTQDMIQERIDKMVTEGRAAAEPNANGGAAFGVFPKAK